MQKSATVSLLMVLASQSATLYRRHSQRICPLKPYPPTLGERKVGEQVNLERSLRLSDRLGGHIVLGHVDEVATICGWKDEGDASLMRVTMSTTIKRYIAYKGSVTVDGISLTVSGIYADAFEVALIPHTKRVTTLGTKRTGASVNLEVDIVARYIETLLKNSETAQPASETLNLNFFSETRLYGE